MTTTRTDCVERWLIVVALMAGGAAASSCEASSAGNGGDKADELTLAGAVSEATPFKDVKILIEHNGTDEDTGFQVFLDGESWNRLIIANPDDEVVLDVRAKGALADLGLTEFFFETNEPPNAEVPIAELLSDWPEGKYQVRGRTIDGVKLHGEATLSHTIPARPRILSPPEDAVVDPADSTVVRWEAVTKSIGEEPVEIVGYQVIIAKVIPEETPLPAGFSKPVLSVHVSGSTTSLTVPREFWLPATEYELEVLALEVGGAQTITVQSLSTK